MEKKEFLNEETYQKNKKKVKTIALFVLLVGFILGGSLIFTGINKNKEVDLKYSTDNKMALAKQIENEKEKLEHKKDELEQQGVEYDVSANYTDGKAYELKLIIKVLDPSFPYYEFDEYKNNTITAKYCSLMEEYDILNSEDYKQRDQGKNYSFFAFGGMTIFFSLVIFSSIYMTTKRREIMAFHAQQVMPIAQEGMEKMAPTMANVGKTITKDMAPVYGEIAKEIAKGVKEGMKEHK